MYWILDGRTPRPATQDEWAESYNHPESRRVAQTKINDDVHVSTVFLGMNHQYGDSPPLLFETMIFGGAHDDYQERCSTFEEAEAGHARAVALAGETD